FGRGTLGRLRGAAGAQRLSASSIVSAGSRRRAALGSPCAQRLSASSIVSALSPEGGADNCCMCSTPFGIIDRFGRLASRRKTVFFACSTPFGIIDRFGAL